MNRYKITVSYDGSGYSGWQVQPNGLTVQECLETVLHTLTGQVVKVHGSGRTDQGVHARQQIAHFDVDKTLVPRVIMKGMNALLSSDIRILKFEPAAPDFHARRSAVSKEYRYFIWNAPILPPFLARYRAHVIQRLDAKAMQKAASQLIGRHDFAAFTASSRKEVDGTVRNLTGLTVTKRGAEVLISARGGGFLYKMVRSLAGYLIRVGRGELSPDTATGILHSRTRTAMVPTAHPQGLFLWRVDY